MGFFFFFYKRDFEKFTARRALIVALAFLISYFVMPSNIVLADFRAPKKGIRCVSNA